MHPHIIGALHYFESSGLDKSYILLSEGGHTKRRNTYIHVPPFGPCIASRNLSPRPIKAHVTFKLLSAVVA
jgi:hypothetical protein